MGYFVVSKQFKYLTKNKFLLVHDNWNDYWDYETLYNLYYFINDGQIIDLGEVKIADTELNKESERKSPDLPNTFDDLSRNFFSVGQSREYYENIYDRLNDMPINPFECLNDMAYDLDSLNVHIRRDVVRNSLLRSVSSTTVQRQFARISRGGVGLTPYEFTYVFNKNYKDDSFGENYMSFNVEVDSTPATNIHVLIGRNGVGKSVLFNNIINVYLKDNAGRGYFLDEYGDKTDPSEIFPNLIYMSYSAFDNSEKIESYDDEWGSGRYTYLGLRKIRKGYETITQSDNCVKKVEEQNKYTNKDLDDLATEFVESLFKCKGSKTKSERLIKSLEILESDPIFQQADIREILSMKENDQDKNKIKNFYKTKLSSGHGIILLTITKLVETVEEKTLVLLDEPETHLHPPLISSFIRCLSELLISRNAVSLIATHSPVILQEVPKNCVWKLDRSGWYSDISRPRFETFGESYSSLVEEVFGLELQKSGFHSLIAEEVDKLEDYESLIEKFDNQLGTDADIIVRTLFLQKLEKNET